MPNRSLFLISLMVGSASFAVRMLPFASAVVSPSIPKQSSSPSFMPMIFLSFQFLNAPIKSPISNLQPTLFATSTSSSVVAIIKSVYNYTPTITWAGASACKALISKTTG